MKSLPPVSPECHLKEVEAVWAPSGEILQALGQVLPVLHGAAALHSLEIHHGLLVTPVKQVDVCVVTRRGGLMRVLWPVSARVFVSNSFAVN